jgi:hypothetical protein
MPSLTFCHFADASFGRDGQDIAEPLADRDPAEVTATALEVVRRDCAPARRTWISRAARSALDPSTLASL